MAKIKKRAGKRATAAGRDGPRRRKSGIPKAVRAGSRKPKPLKSKPTKSKSRRPKLSAASEAARLNEQLKIARMQQQASAEVLRAVANASGDAARPLQLIAETTERLFAASAVTIRIAGPGDEWSHVINVGEGARRIAAAVPAAQLTISGHNMPGVVFRENRQIHLPDIENVDPAIAAWPGLRPARTAGTRTVVGIPLRRDGKAIGALIVHRGRVAAFADDELALLQSFADQAVIAIENARLFNETKEALERQTATAEILKVIASSPSDVQPVFEAIVERSTRLVTGFSAAVHLVVDGQQHLKAFTRISPEADAVVQAAFPRPLTVLSGAARILSGEVFEITDTEVEFAQQPPLLEMGRKRGYRSLVVVPLLRGREPIGLINVTRKEPGHFAPHHVNLLRTFADQAVIAIENARLFNETKEALERQTATADILKVIASSPSDVQPVFEAIAARANSLVGGFSATVFRFIDGVAHLMAFTPTTREADEVLKSTFPSPVDSFAPFQMARDGEVTRIADTETLTDEILDIARARGFRSMMFAPLMNKGESIGLIAVTRLQPGTFSDHHVQLLRTFADQAVIAIENVRLFDEVQARTRELEEALQQQMATSDILAAINSSGGDLAPVFDCILEKAHLLCGAPCGSLQLYQDGKVVPVAIRGMTPAFTEYLQRGYPITEGIRGGLFADHPVQRIDMVEFLREQPDEPSLRAAVELGRVRTMVWVPLLKDGVVFGRIIAARQEVQPFDDKQIAMLEGFAAQAVIAIENARLLQELRARTDDLSESLQQQTATADVLDVISRSAFDLNPVFETVAESSVKLCGSDRALIFRFDGELLRVTAAFNAPRRLMDWLKRNPIQPGQYSVAARAALERRTVHVLDVLADPEHTYGAKDVEPFRTVVGVPMLKGNDLFGVILVYHNEVRPFTEKQIALVQTFADQAVIAIENVRLFEQVQERTRELSKSLDDLRSAQDRLVQTEKLASLGQLTAGIAHEIKNPLNFVNNFSALST